MESKRSVAILAQVCSWQESIAFAQLNPLARYAVVHMSIRRLAEAMRNDEETKEFIVRVDNCFGKGGYLVNKSGDYMNADDFARDESLDLGRLCEFLHLFGDIEAPIGEMFGLGTDAKLSDLIDYDRGLLAICGLEAKGVAMFGVIVKFALHYARNSAEQIPRALMGS